MGVVSSAGAEDTLSAGSNKLRPWKESGVIRRAGRGCHLLRSNKTQLTCPSHRGPRQRIASHGRGGRSIVPSLVVRQHSGRDWVVVNDGAEDDRSRGSLENLPADLHHSGIVALGIGGVGGG
jgi:hypothetical protein